MYGAERRVLVVPLHQQRDALLALLESEDRDARRLHGRGPYKDNLWFSIERPAELWSANTCLWFGLEPEGWSYGCG